MALSVALRSGVGCTVLLMSKMVSTFVLQSRAVTAPQLTIWTGSMDSAVTWIRISLCCLGESIGAISQSNTNQISDPKKSSHRLQLISSYTKTAMQNILVFLKTMGIQDICMYILLRNRK